MKTSCLAHTPQASHDRHTPRQPLNVIDVDGALLKLSTLSALAGRSRSTLDRDEKSGLLKVTRRGTRCTRVKAEDARAYLQALAGGKA